MPDLRSFASATLPALQEHLTMARSMAGGGGSMNHNGNTNSGGASNANGNSNEHHQRAEGVGWPKIPNPSQ